MTPPADGVTPASASRPQVGASESMELRLAVGFSKSDAWCTSIDRKLFSRALSIICSAFDCQRLETDDPATRGRCFGRQDGGEADIRADVIDGHPRLRSGGESAY